MRSNWELRGDECGVAPFYVLWARRCPPCSWSWATSPTRPSFPLKSDYYLKYLADGIVEACWPTSSRSYAYALSKF